MTNHEELVRRIAEEMAEAQYKKSFSEIAGGSPFMPGCKFDPNSRIAQSAIRSIAQTLIPAARVAVKHMAEAHGTGFRAGLRYANTGKGVTGAEDLLNKGLISKEEYIQCLNAPKIKRSED